MNDVIDAIINKVYGGFNRAVTTPNPNMSDKDILDLYRGRTNMYATPEALRDVELGVQAAFNDPRRTFELFYDDMRDKALRARGLKYNQSYDEIPEKSPTGRIMKEVIKNLADGSYSGA